MSYLERLKQLETHQNPTDKTDRSTFVSSVSPLPVRIETEPFDREAWEERAAVSDDTAGKATDDPLPEPAMEARRQRVLAMLANRPGIRYAVAVDNPDTEPVILALAVRDAMQDGSNMTCELHIPRAKFDAFLLLDKIERHSGTLQ